MDKRPRKKPTRNKQEISLVITPPSKKGPNKNGEETKKQKEAPPREVTVERRIEPSVTSESISIHEYGMKTSKKGLMTAFNMGIRLSLFPKVKFLGGTNTSLDYSTEPTSVCGLLKKHCNIDDADARLWWEEKRNMVKGIHTECRNNKIKTIKQIFKGKCKREAKHLKEITENATHLEMCKLG